MFCSLNDMNTRSFLSFSFSIIFIVFTSNALVSPGVQAQILFLGKI